MAKVQPVVRKSGKKVYKVKIWSPVDEKEVWYGRAYDDELDAQLALREAQKLVKEHKSLVAAQKKTIQVRPTLGKAVDAWYEHCETTQENRKRASTLKDYETNRRHLKELLGEGTPLGAIDKSALDKMVLRFRYGDDYETDPEPKHSERATRKLTIRFKQVINYVKDEQGWEVHRQAEAYRPFRVEQVANDYVPLPPSWFKAMLEKFDPQFRCMLLIAAGAGLRRGEILALKPKDIQWNGGEPRIQVSQALINGKESPLKTARARRAVPIGTGLCRALTAYMKAERPDIDPYTDFIFVTPKNKRPWIDTYFSRAFNEQVQRIADRFPQVALPCERVGLHRARHLYASVALAKGMSILHLSKNLGHKSPALTLAVYSHLMKDTDREHIEGVDSEVMGYLPKQKRRQAKPKATAAGPTSKKAASH